MENTVMDGDTLLSEIAGHRDQFLQQAVARGGDPDQIKKFYQTLWPHGA